VIHRLELFRSYSTDLGGSRRPRRRSMAAASGDGCFTVDRTEREKKDNRVGAAEWRATAL